MNLSKSILDITLNEVIADEVVTQETKDKLKEVFSSNNSQEIDSLILGNLIFFAKYSVIKEIYNNSIFTNACLSFMKSSNFRDTEQLLTRLSDNINLHGFLNQEVFVNEFLENSSLVSILGRIDGFFDNFHDPIRSNIITQFLSEEEINLLTLQRLPNDIVDKLLNDDIYKESIYHDVLSKIIDSVMSINNPYVEAKIWETYQDRIALLSLKNKVDYFRNINDDSLKKTVFETLKLAEDIANIDDFDLKYVVPYVDQDILFNKCISNDLNVVSKFIPQLDTAHQIKVIYELDKLGVRLSNYYYALNIETKSYIFEHYPHLLNDYQIYQLYQESENINCLNELKKRFLVSNDIVVKVLYEDNFVKLLTEEEKEILASKIPVDGSISHPYDVVKFNDYFFNISKSQNINYLRQNPDKQIFVSVNNLIDYYTISEQLEIINHMGLNWLREILENDKKFDFFVNILHNTPDFLKDKDLSNITIGYVNSNILDRIDEILPYFSDEQLNIFFDRNIIQREPKVLEIFKQKAYEKPDLINSLYLLEYFNSQDQTELLRNMSIENLNDLIQDGGLRQHINVLDILYERFDEYINYVNMPKYYAFTNVNDIYLLLDSHKREELVSKLTAFPTLEQLLLYLQKKQLYNDCEQVLNRLIFNYESIMNSDMKKELKLSRYDSVNMQYFITHSSLVGLMYTSSYYANKDIINEIMSYIRNDSTVLINEELLLYINSFVLKLTGDDINYINDEINKLINSNPLYNSEYKDRLTGISGVEKLEFLYLYRMGILQGDKKIAFDHLLKKNKFILNSINSIMFNDNILELGESFIEKVSKYPNMERQLKNLNNTNPKILEFIGLAGKYLLNRNTSQLAFDREISMIIEYLSSPQSKLKDYDFTKVNDQNIANIVNYILYEYENLIVVYNPPQTIYRTVNELYTLSIDNFTNERVKKCDEEFYKSIDLNDKKNMYFNKYLSMSLSDARNFYQSYVVNYHKVMQYAENDIPLKFIELINKVIDIDDPITLEEIYNTETISYSMADRFTIEGMMQKAYFESLVNDYVNKQQGTKVTKQYKDKEGNLVSLEMTELIDNFGVILHSTCAYGEMPLLDNDYFNAWNNNPNTENHGICCSYITNSSYGTAAVSGNGVMFGFTKLNNTSVSTYSPYDLATKNFGYNITCRYTPFYTTLNDIPDFTRHTHNEFNLERRNYSIDPRFASVQPDCIIIFEDMDENIKANSIQAYQDFKKHGIELKLIYIDRVKVANNEASKLDAMMKEYLITYDLNILREIINKYESNICGCDFIGMGKEESLNLFNQHELFKTDKIKELLQETIKYIANIPDINERNAKITAFIKILDDEQYKFDLLDDMNKDRAHKFELYDDNLKQQVEQLRLLITDDSLIDQRVK